MLRDRLIAPTVAMVVSAAWSHTRCGRLTAPVADSALLCSARHKSSTVRIANRRKVEMFVGKRFHLPTRLRTAAPDVAREWNYEKNPMHIYPEIIGIGHMTPVWWCCEECGHEYEMSVEKRVVRGGGCPACLEHVTVAAPEESVPAEASAPRLQKADLLDGELNAALRPKRPTMLNLRTKY